MIAKKLFFRYFLIGLLTAPYATMAQDDLMNLIADDSTRSPYTEATFKSSRVVSLQSNETVHARTLDLRISHRFGAIGTSSNGTSSVHNLWGFDEVGDVRIAFEYGITDRLMAGFSRSKHNENWEVLGKYRLLRQRKDNRMPIALTLFSNVSYSSRVDNQLTFDNPTDLIAFQRRFAYCSQLIIARKFSSNFSLELLPTFIHRNFTFYGQENNLFALGGGLRYKFTPASTLILDYVFCPPRKAVNYFGGRDGAENGPEFRNPLSLGFELETGGHVFALMFTNAASMLEQEFIPETYDSWSAGGFRFSFTISRSFHFR